MNPQTPIEPQTFFLIVAGHKLEVARIPAADNDKPVVVLLHEGLGSIALWRDFPSVLASETGCEVIIYSRYGYGNSEVLAAPREPDYMHREALDALPHLLAQLEVRSPILIGHSDGASIGLIYAGAFDALTGLVVMAPHLFVEEIAVAGVGRAKIAFGTSGLPAKLAPYHQDAEKTFRGWSDIWSRPDFRPWNIEGYLPHISCPVLAIQGIDDEYGTMVHLERIAEKVSGPVELLKLADCGHSPHRDRPKELLNAIGNFIDNPKEKAR